MAIMDGVCRTLETVSYVRRNDMHMRSSDATYGMGMGDAEDGPDEWARYLRAICERPGWSVARLARETGVNRSTVFRWLSDGGESVTIRSIRSVAQAVGDDLEVALRAAADLPAAEPTVDEELELIRQARVPGARKVEMVRRLLERREREHRQRIEDLRWMIDSGHDRSGQDRVG
jgi:transcriptional regulator with XRE-family HTH domain